MAKSLEQMFVVSIPMQGVALIEAESSADAAALAKDMFKEANLTNGLVLTNLGEPAILFSSGGKAAPVAPAKASVKAVAAARADVDSDDDDDDDSGDSGDDDSDDEDDDEAPSNSMPPVKTKAGGVKASVKAPPVDDDDDDDDGDDDEEEEEIPKATVKVGGVKLKAPPATTGGLKIRVRPPG